MLFVTTRSGYDVYTPAWTYRTDRAGDGGFYIPYRFPQLEEGWLKRLETMSMGDGIAWVLNYFYRCGLTGWDVERAIGKRPVRILGVGHKMRLAELWHGLNGGYEATEKQLAALIRGDGDTEKAVTSGLRIGIRISFLLTLYAGLVAIGEADWDHRMDIAVAEGDLSALMSVYYAAQLGLPVGNILCGCREEGGLWELLHHGYLDAAAKPAKELERLIFCRLGMEAAAEYAACRDDGKPYRISQHQLKSAAADICCHVISDQRISMLQSNMRGANDLPIGPETACAYGALLDHRADTGEGRMALILSEDRP